MFKYPFGGGGNEERVSPLSNFTKWWTYVQKFKIERKETSRTEGLELDSVGLGPLGVSREVEEAGLTSPCDHQEREPDSVPHKSASTLRTPRIFSLWAGLCVLIRKCGVELTFVR